jgi:hypothetical protein
MLQGGGLTSAGLFELIQAWSHPGLWECFQTRSFETKRSGCDGTILCSGSRPGKRGAEAVDFGLSSFCEHNDRKFEAAA